MDVFKSLVSNSLCLHSFPGQQEHPCIECGMVLLPEKRASSNNVTMVVQQSVNSARISVAFTVSNPNETSLLAAYMQFLMHRADELNVVRRSPIEGNFDLTFLVTSHHLQRYKRDGLVAFICGFVDDLHSTLTTFKGALRSRARVVANQFWEQLEEDFSHSR